MNTLQVHRKGDPQSVWQLICESRNCQWLCDRALRLAEMFKRRPQDGYDTARVIRGRTIIAEFGLKERRFAAVSA